MNRRDFNKKILSLGTFQVLSPLAIHFFSSNSFAQTSSLNTAPSKYFLMLYAGAGWDTTLAMDPWVLPVRLPESEIFVEYRPDELLPFQNGKLVGPAMKPFEKYFSKMAIINGVFMGASDNGHTAASNYIESGNGQGNLAALPAELEGPLFHSAFGTMANDSNMPSGGKAKRIWDISSPGEIDPTDSFIDSGENTELATSRRALAGNSSKIIEFNKVLKACAGSDSPKIKDVLAAAFYSDLSRSGFIEMDEENLDTHSDHPEKHKASLIKHFTSITAVFDTLAKVEDPTQKGVSILDQTTIMIVTEFTRTPALNASKGKDHNPQSNSVIVMGPGINPGVYGASRVVERKYSAMGAPYLSTVPLDIKTQQPVRRQKDTFILRPETVTASVIKSMGLEPKSISVGLGKAPLLNGLIKI